MRVLAAAVAAALASPAWSATISWSLPLSGNWGAAGLWSGGSVPTAADTALINVAGTNTISVTGGTFSVGSVQIAFGNRLALSGGGLNVGAGITDTSSAGVLINGGRLSLGGNSSALNFTMSSGELSGTGALSVTGSAVVSGGAMTGGGITTFLGPATFTNTLSLGTGRLLRVFGGASVNGTIDVATGARLNIAFATFDNAALTGGGTLVALDTGLTFNTDTAIATRAELGRVQFLGAGDVTFNGPASLADHLIVVGTGRGDVRFNGAMSITTTNAFPMRIDDGRTVTIAGGATFTSGLISLNPANDNRAAAGRLVNAAGSELVFNTTTTAGVVAANYGNADNGLSALFRNEGLLTIRGTGVTTLDVSVQSVGTVAVDASTLEFTRPSVLDGTLLVSGPGTMRFSSGSHDIGAAFIGGGAFVLNPGATWAMRAGLHEMRNGSLSGGGTLAVAPGALLDLNNFSLATPVQLNGGELRATGGISVSGAISALAPSTFTAAGPTDSGIFTLSGGLTLKDTSLGIDRGAQLLLSSTAEAANFTVLLNPFTNPGEGSGRLAIGSGNRWRDVGNGASTFRADSFGATDNGVSARLVINGVYEKSGPGVTTLAAPTILNGSLEITRGRLDITRDADLYGAISIGGNGVLRLHGGGHRLFGGTVTGAGGLELRGGAYVEVRAPYTVAASAVLDAADFAGTSTLTFTAPARVDPGAVRVLAPMTLAFAGGLDVPSSDLFQFFIANGGEMRITGGATFADVAIDLNPVFGSSAGRLVNAAGSTIIDNPAAGRGSGVFTYDRGGTNTGRDALFTNAGTYIKRGSGTGDFSAPTLNTGTVRIEQGTMFFSDDSTQAGAIQVVGPGILNVRGGTHTFRDGASISGTVNANAPASITFGPGVSRLLDGGITGTARVTFGPESAVVVPGSFSIANPVTIAGGTFDFGGNLTLSGPVTLSPDPVRAVFLSPGTTTFSGVLTGATGPGPGTLLAIDLGHTVRIEGQAVVGNFSFETNPFFNADMPSGRIIIAPGATFEDRTTTSSRAATLGYTVSGLNSVQRDDGRSALFAIEGRYLKTGPGSTVISMAVEISGIVEVNAGTLRISYGTTVRGAVATSGSGVFIIGGRYTMLGGSSLSGNFESTFAGVNYEAGRHTLSNGGVVAGPTVAGFWTVNTGALLELDRFTFGSGLVLRLAGGELRTSTESVLASSVELTAESSITGPGLTRLTGTLAMASGQQLNLDLGARLSIEGTATLSGFTLELNRFDTPGLPSGQLTVASGGTLRDTGGDASIRSTNHGPGDSGSGASFTVAGSYVKTGAGTTTVGVATTITGLVDVGAGVLRFDGAPLNLSGAVTIGAGARMEIANHRVFLGDPRRVIFNGGSVSGAGVLAVNETTVSFDTDTVIGSALDIGRAAFYGAGNLRVTGPTTLTNHLLVIGGAGGPSSTGNVRFEGMVTMTSADGGGSGSQFPMRIDDGRTVTFAGGALLTGGELVVNPADFGTSVAGRIVNEAGSTFVFRPTVSAGILNRNYGAFDNGRSALFTNAGIVRAEGPGVTTIGAPFVNTGTVRVEQGTMFFSDDSTQAGALEVVGTGVLQIRGGTHTFGDGSSLNGAVSAMAPAAITFGTGVSRLLGGGITGNAPVTFGPGSGVVVPTSFSIANPVTLDGGRFDFGGTLTLNGPVTLSPNRFVLVSPGTTVISGAFTGPTGPGQTTRIALDLGHTLRIEGQAVVGNFDIELNPVFNASQTAGRLVIAPGAVFEDRTVTASRIFTAIRFFSDQSGTSLDDGRNALVSIQGRYVKTGPGATGIFTPLEVNGAIEVNDGTLTASSPSTTVRGAITTTGAGVYVIGGNYTMLGGSSLSGAFILSWATSTFEAGVHSLSNGSITAGGGGGGSFIANPGARLDLDMFTMGAGTTLVLAGGEIRTLTNATIAGDVRLTAESSFTGPGTTRLTGALTMTAGQQLNLDLGQRLNIEGSATLSGFRIDLNRFNTPGVPAGQLSVANGATVFDNAGDASIFATNHGAADNGSSASLGIFGRYQKTGAGTTTFGVATTIAGGLDIGAGVLRVDSARLSHAGTIDIGAGARMEIANHRVFLGDPRLVIFNGGSVIGAGTLALNETTVSFDTDTVIGSALEIGRAAFVGGGNVRVTGPTTLTNHLLVIGGIFGTPSTGNVRFEGMVTMTSANSSGNGSQFPMRIDDGRTVTFAGGALLTGGELVVNPADFGTSVAGRIVNEAGSTFVFRPTTSAGILNRSYGAFDDGRSALFSNAGTVRAEGPGVATIGAPFVNTGAVQVAGGTLRTTDTFTHSGTINVSAGLLDIAGGVQAGVPGAGAMAIGAAGSARIGAASTLGTVNVAAGGALTLDAALTIDTDFTNANAGFGNAFNRRGGISGTGQLLAGGAPIQTVIGNGIADGSSLTPTITLGTMRAGTIRQYSFSIANTGNSPALRGALQTTGANGGNLTDAQIAFGPANFGPGSVHGLTFTPGSAGALSIAPDQRIAVFSQFDNVATQFLSITVDPNAKVYTPAVLAQNLGNVDFGVVRVGDVATRNVGTIGNSAAATALNDVLITSFSGNGAPFTLSDPGALGGGQTSTLTATLDTSAARAASTRNVTATFASHNPDMADLALGSASFTLGGQVNNLASAAFRMNAGPAALTQQSATSFLLDFGDIARGATGIVTTRLAAWNRAPAGAPSDRLVGVLQPQRGPGSGAFVYGGFSGRFDLDADQRSLELLLDVDTTRIGQYSDTLLLGDLFSVYAGLADFALPQMRLDLRLTVFDPASTVIPLPGAAWLLLGGLAALGATARRRKR